MGTKRILFLGALLAARTVVLVGEEPAQGDKKPKAKAEAGATVTVTAEASPVEVEKTPNPVKVITAEQIERIGAKDLGGLLARILPGQVVRQGGAGAITSLFLNGTRSRDVVVTLDGLPINDLSSDSVDFSSISMAGVERVEVLTGACSVLAGADAIGGIIALHTAGPAPQGAQGQIVQAVGTEGKSSTALSHSQGFNKAWFKVGLSGDRENAPTETINPYRQAAGYVSGGVWLADEHSLDLVYRNAYIGRPVPYVASDPTYSNLYDPTRESSGRVESLALHYLGQLPGEWILEARLGDIEQTRREVGTERSPASPYSSTRLIEQMNVRREGTDWGLAFRVENNKEKANMYAYPGENKGEARRFSTSGEAHWSPLDSLRGVLSLRQQKDSLDYTPKGMSTKRDESNSTVFKAGLNWDLSAGVRIYGSYGTSYALAPLSNVLYNMAGAPGEAELKDEKSRSTLAGMSWNLGSWRLALDLNRTFYDRFVFYNRNNKNGTYGAFENGSDLRVQGMELQLDYSQANVTTGLFVRSQEARDMKAPKEQQLSTSVVVRRPFFSGGLHGQFQVGSWGAQWRWTYSGSYYDAIGYPDVLSSRTHYNDLMLGGTYAFSKDVTISLRGQNLLQPRITKQDWLAKRTDFQNDAYRAYNFPAAPPSWTLEIRLKY